MKLLIRGLKQRADDGSTIEGENPTEAMEKALAVKDCIAPEPVISWHDRTELAVLDIDFHESRPPNRWQVERDIERMLLQPRFAWVSHGGGAKLIYVKNELLTANEQAVLTVGLFGNAFEGHQTPEIKTDTRHPGYPRVKDGVTQECSKVRPCCTNLERTRSRLFGDLYGEDPNLEDAWNEWLEEEGIAEGERIDSGHCLIKRDHKPDKCVMVCGEPGFGLYCFKCAGRGRCYFDGLQPGWSPPSALVDSWRPKKVNLIRECAKNFCHFDHAVLVLRAEMPWLQERWEKTAYSGLLKLYHLLDAEEERKEAIQTRINQTLVRFPMVRTEDHWLEATDLRTVVHAGLEKRIASLPAVKFWDDRKRDWKVSGALVGEFQGGGDLTTRGYPPVVIIPGADLAAEVRPPTGRIYVPKPSKVPFTYVWESKRRMEFVDEVFKEAFPTINMQLLRLLLVAGGFAQRDDSPYPPMVLITGLTGSGKSATAYVAAEVLGCYRDSVSDIEVTYMPKEEQHTLRAYSGAFPLALLDDFTKGQPTDEQIKLLLTQRLKKGATFHGLYIGVQRIAMAGAVVMTAIRLPSCIQTDMQLARRVVHVDLGSGARGARVEWDKTCGGNITGWRGRQRQNTEACDMLLSDLKDRFFSLGYDPKDRALVEATFGARTTTFFEAAQKLGFCPVIGQKGENDPYVELRALFDAACAEPDSEASHFQGRGWKVFHLDEGTPFRQAFTNALEACDGNITNPNTWEAVESCQWSDVLGVKGIEFKFKRHGKRVGMKWGDRSFHDPNVKLNQEIEGIEREVQPVQPLAA